MPVDAYPREPADTGFPQRDYPWGIEGEQSAVATGVVAVLTTAKDGRSEWLAAGQALQRVLLYACAYGVSAAFHTQALEVPLLREFLREELCGGARRARSTRSPPCAWAAGGAGRDLRRRIRGLSPLGSRLAAGVDGSEVSIAESRNPG